VPKKLMTKEPAIDPVLSYLDPGTSATLMQLALAGFGGLAAFTKLRMNAMKRRLRKADDAEVDDADPIVEGTTPVE
jgi:hypothetical protein